MQTSAFHGIFALKAGRDDKVSKKDSGDVEYQQQARVRQELCFIKAH